MPTLNDIIERFRSGSVDDALWLYVSDDDNELTICTPADLGCLDYNDETDEEIHPPGFTERGLSCTIEAHAVDASIEWADRLSGKRDNQAAAKIIQYYIRFDAWPETLDAPDPPPAEESLRRIYREFADSLGAERPDTKCKRENCDRGTVAMSVLCRRHHFENVKGVDYPFDD
ncbi:MAG: hypothetical protein AAFQ57_14705 [Cyanobacteria bacterium J06626_14]